MSAESITVRTFKYDGAPHRSWKAEMARSPDADSLLILDAVFNEEIRHPLLGTIALGTVSIEYYWLDRWYNVFQFMGPSGELQSFYCNVNVPPVLHNNILSYIDLDIDILVKPDFSYTVLDEDEFEIHTELFGYPADIVRHSQRARDQLLTLIETRQFPFDSFK